MESCDELFDDANGDLAVGDIENAVQKYRRCIEIDPEFSMADTSRNWHHEDLVAFPGNREAEKRVTPSRVPNDQRSPGPACPYPTTAMATSRKPKPWGRRQRSLRGGKISEQ